VIHPSHIPHEVFGHCLTCGMTHEEMCDFAQIECVDAQQAQMKMPTNMVWSGWMSDLTDIEHTQRGIMLTGLHFMAVRRKGARRRLAEWKARGAPIFELVEADRPD
jgi:hypothetical protein